jgi:hypothetical protein
MDANQLRETLSHFTGSTSFTRHGRVRCVRMTEGITYLPLAAGALYPTCHACYG